jgi:hypothetical protein
MTDPLTDFLEDRVQAATPAVLPGFDDVRRRAGRQRLHVVAAVAATLALIGGLGVAGWAVRGGQGDAVEPAQSPTVPTLPTSRPATTYDPDLPASGIVAVLPEGDQPLPVNDRCWGDEECLRVLMEGQTGPDLGSPGALDFRFERPGWDFTATFRPLGASCPRTTTVEAEQRGGGLLRVDPAGEAGTYQVDLWGAGENGFVSTRFVWTTTADGPVEPPTGKLHVAPDSRTGPAHAFEIAFDDLGFQPSRAEVGPFAGMTIVAADGTRSQVEIPLVAQSLPCQARGTFYYQGEWFTEITPRGPAPWDVEVAVTIRGTEHLGRGSWPGPSDDPNLQPYVPLTWKPALSG